MVAEVKGILCVIVAEVKGILCGIVAEVKVVLWDMVKVIFMFAEVKVVLNVIL